MVRGLQPLRTLHILVVENDPNAYSRIQHALGSEFIVRHARTLAEAKLYLEEHIPDVLICEVLLGQESGLDLCRFIRGSAHAPLRYIPIMLLTSLTTLQDKVAGFDAGADDYVVKPFDARHLMARIRLLSRIKRLEKRNDE
jgi:DNA-binding response OmpR family regulator